ncbi:MULTISPECIES: hypothetical protein [unclassified Aeromicrobium]|uniref:hypothetical protein n=1 Tax=unclassified Aeromicrobium TaxID=2633570 RepID=UPI00396B07D4
MTMLDFAVLATQEIDPEGNQPIGWLAGLYTLALFIVIGLLLWSFTKMAKKARQPWEGEDDAPADEDPPKP